MDGGYLQSFKENLLSEYKIHKRESKLLKQNNREEKEILPFMTQYQLSVSTIKEAWMEKVESFTKPTTTSINFKRTTNHFLTKQENHYTCSIEPKKG